MENDTINVPCIHQAFGLPAQKSQKKTTTTTPTTESVQNSAGSHQLGHA